MTRERADLSVFRSIETTFSTVTENPTSKTTVLTGRGAYFKVFDGRVVYTSHTSLVECRDLIIYPKAVQTRINENEKKKKNNRFVTLYRCSLF